MWEFCDSCEGNKTCEFVNGVSEYACDEKIYFEDGYNRALTDIEKFINTHSSTEDLTNYIDELKKF